MSARHLRRWLPLLVAWAASAILAAHYLETGWVPHDAGSLAQGAERVLDGQLPHRDFDDIYTGGLSLVNALAFRVLGTNLVTLRLVLFAFFVAWVPAVYYVASRFVSPLAAGLTTLVAVAWSLPNYPEAIPSWYSLFFAVFGVAALLRHLETNRRGTLWLAGLAGGLSCLAKIVGLYYLVAALLFVVAREHVLARAEGTPDAGAGRVYAATVSAGLVSIVMAVAGLIRQRAAPAEVVHCVLPVVALAVLLGWPLWAEPAGPSRARFARLARLAWPLALGAAVPIALFLVPYAYSGALGALWQGVFVAPAKRLSFATMAFPELRTMRMALPLPVLLWLVRRRSPRVRQATALAAALGLGIVLWWGAAGEVYRGVWEATRPLVPVTVLGGVLLALAAPADALGPVRRQQLTLLLAVAGLCSLVQFPFAAPVYFCYVAPLGILAAVAVVATWDPRPHPVGAVVLGFSLVFALRWVNPGFIMMMGRGYAPTDQTELLPLARGGVRVSRLDAVMFPQLAATVQAHAQGDYIFAFPDCPEVYFLTGKRNPTRTLFDFLDDPAGRTARVLDLLEQRDVHLIVLNRALSFSGVPPRDLLDALSDRFPRGQAVYRFDVRWRD